MKNLTGLVALMIAVSPAAALAQEQVYYHAGAWDAFSGRNSSGGPVCGIGNTNPANGQRLSLQFDIGGTDTVFSVSKPNWSIPDKTRLSVVLQVGLNTPWTPSSTGSGNIINWTLDRLAMQTFDHQFRTASSMTVTFPDGNEPPWTVSLVGSTAISDTLARCIRDLTQQVQAAQPRAPAEVGTPGATQPFAAPR